MVTEIWKDVVGYSGIYEDSNLGRVRSLDRLDTAGRKRKGRILKQTLSNYLRVILCNGKKKTRLVHQLVCETFIGPRPEGKEVCHGPSGKLDNSLTNLRYGTHSENALDRNRDGTSGRNRRAVIRSDDREFISQSEAARVTNCAQGDISKCCKGKLKTVGGYGWEYADGTD